MNRTCSLLFWKRRLTIRELTHTLFPDPVALGGGSSQISSIPSLESWERNLETLGEFLFRAKKEWHERQARLSFSEKIKIMDKT